MSHFNPLSPENTRLGWIGTGVMGSRMVGHLIDAGYSTTLFNRSPAKAAPMIDRGAVWADSPRAVAENSDVVVTILGYPDDVAQVYRDPHSGLLSGIRPGMTLIDMTTSRPQLATEIAQAAQRRGAAAIDAPVSGGDLGAQNATLSIMIGGEPSVVDAARPLLEVIGKTVVHQGPPGAGQHTKMVNQTLIAAAMISVCEALLYAEKAGLDLPTVMQSVSSGAAGSWSLSNLGPRIIDGDFEPGFFVEHFIKDMGIVLEEARRMQLCLPGLALASQLYQSVAVKGWQRKGTQALYLALAEINAMGT